MVVCWVSVMISTSVRDVYNSMFMEQVDHASDVWLSCYVYYDDSADTCLVSDIWPLTRSLQQSKQILSFFFIRYVDQRGPHIRLRLRVSSHQADTVKQSVKSVFPHVHFSAYVPEVRRYGGPAGLPVSEQLFEASSVVVLTQLAAATSWSSEMALGFALQLHLIMASSFGLRRDETARLFEHIAASFHHSDTAAAEQLQANFEGQKTVAVRARAYWNACIQGNAPGPAWLSSWQTETKTIGAAIRKLQRSGALTIPYKANHGPDQLWQLYESYIHMTNNRLGVRNRDEPVIANLISGALAKS